MKDSENAASSSNNQPLNKISVDDVMKIAQEEIRRTSEEAVKAALVEVSGELACEKERAREFEKRNRNLEAVNRQLKDDAEKLKGKNKRGNMLGAFLGGAGGIVITSVVFSICSLFEK